MLQTHHWSYASTSENLQFAHTFQPNGNGFDIRVDLNGVRLTITAEQQAERTLFLSYCSSDLKASVFGCIPAKVEAPRDAREAVTQQDLLDLPQGRSAFLYYGVGGGEVMGIALASFVEIARFRNESNQAVEKILRESILSTVNDYKIGDLIHDRAPYVVGAVLLR